MTNFPNKQLKEEWREDLEKMATKIYQGQLPHAIYGDLHDPEKLESFIQSQIDKAKKEALQKAKEGVICKQCSKDLKTEKNAPNATS